ncbi:MAG: DNA helicase UvrD [Candidatus Aenigmarchaeota archaeon]|nr:DNA helicase UvrD [Candidatus Aenigmarchaeota archaeon]
MRIIADLHIHSKYARACSKDLDLAHLEQYARLKGLQVLGTGDFQHPRWMQELQELEQGEDGLLRSKTGFPFLLQTEISLMYSQGGKGRRVHLLVLAPHREAALQIADVLGKRGRLDYDGRPIFGMPCPEFVELMRGVSPEAEVIPAHAWTPYFGVFGSKTGFDRLEDCFQDQARHVHAIETGLSSDPPMNWRLRQLDKIQLLSFSDCHSFWPHRLGREATVFSLPQLSYQGILQAIRTGSGLEETIEVNPAYGKYHWDGHAACGVAQSPAETKKQGIICPRCRRPLTIGVEYRVEELADRPAGERPPAGKGYRSLLPLMEILAFARGTAVFAKETVRVYHQLVGQFGTEFALLLDAPDQQLEQLDPAVAQAILGVRRGEIRVRPGYDGVYGVPEAPGAPRAAPPAGPQLPRRGQTSLFSFGTA